MPTSREDLLKTTETFISLFTQPMSPAAALALRTPDCKHYLRPSSVPNLTFETSEASVASLHGLQWAWRNYRFALVDGRAPVIDVEARKSVFWVTGSADTVDGPYRHDILFMLTMEEDEKGGRVEEIVEICDSAYLAGWMVKFADEDFKRRSLEWQAEQDTK